MTLFEYLAAGYVLILSFAVVRGFAGVPYALRSTSRYWIHLVYLLIALSNCLMAFWAFWFYRDVEWTFVGFIVTLAFPVLLYTHVSLLVPLDPSTVSSWRDHFFDVRVPLFTAGGASGVAWAISNQVVLGIPSLHFLEWPVYAAIAIYAIGLTSARPNLHAALALAFPCVVAVVPFVILAQGDPLAPIIP